jgi:hypothetical protein
MVVTTHPAGGPLRTTIVAIYSSGNARRTRTAGPARSTRVALVVAAALLVGSVTAALAVGTPAPPTAVRSPAPTIASTAACEPAAATAGPVVPTATLKQRYALPTGWIWYGDHTGLAVAVPRGWARTADGSRTCFRDPDGGRAFGVDTAVRVGGSRATYFEQAELAELVNDALPGYESIGAGSLQLRNGGADWEFRWRPSGGPLLHERRVLLSMGAGRTYLVTWTTREADWSINEPNQELILASIG